MASTGTPRRPSEPRGPALEHRGFDRSSLAFTQTGPGDDIGGGLDTFLAHAVGFRGEIRESIDELDRADDAIEDPAIGLKISHGRDRHGIEERTVAQLRREEDDVLGLAERRGVRHHRAQPAAASYLHTIVP